MPRLDDAGQHDATHPAAAEIGTAKTAATLPQKQPHWLAVVSLLIAGLAVAGLISYLGSTTLVS